MAEPRQAVDVRTGAKTSVAPEQSNCARLGRSTCIAHAPSLRQLLASREQRRTGQGRHGSERSERSLDAAKRSRTIGPGPTAGTRLNALLEGHRTRLTDSVAASLSATPAALPGDQRTGVDSVAVVKSPRRRLSRALHDEIAVTSATNMTRKFGRERLPGRGRGH